MHPLLNFANSESAMNLKCNFLDSCSTRTQLNMHILYIYLGFLDDSKLRMLSFVMALFCIWAQLEMSN